MVPGERLDLATGAYAASVLSFVLAFRARIDAYPLHAAFDAGVVLAAWLFHKLRRRGDAAAALTVWYPILLFTPLYYQTGLLNRILIPRLLDPYFLRLDQAFFGEFPAFPLHRALGGVWFGEFMHLAYLSYYAAIPGVALLLFVRRRAHFDGFALHLSTLFYFCYAIYILLPVEGPLWLRPRFFGTRGPLCRLVDSLYAAAENPGAAFPSSHVAVAWLVAWWGAREFPRARTAFWTQAALLSLATVYCSFHYAVDVVAGMLLAFAWIRFGETSCTAGRRGARRLLEPQPGS